MNFCPRNWSTFLPWFPGRGQEKRHDGGVGGVLNIEIWKNSAWKNFFSIALFLISMSYKLSFFRSYSLNCSVWANYALKGKYTEKIVSHFLLQSDRPSKMMKICKKKVGQNFHYFVSIDCIHFSFRKIIK